MTSNHKRWKVAQHILSKMWVTWNDGDMKENPIRLADRTVRAFRTHAEALAYADRMARTVEVTLPRVVDAIARIPNSPNPTEEETWYSHRRDGSCLLDAPYRRAGSFTVSKGEAVPLALTLLALHYRSTTP